MNLIFKALSAFWMLSPVGFLIGRSVGVWNTKLDWAIFLGLMLMSAIACFFNYTPEDCEQNR